MELSRRIAAAYDQVAESYAEKNSEMPPAYLDLGPRFLARAAPGLKVLDVGCGAGRDLAWLTQQGTEVVGADRSAGMLTQARGQASGWLVQVDMRSLPFKDGAFGGVWCSASLLHLPKHDAPGALAEMRRVLAPGGPFLLGIQEGDSEGWEPSPYAVPVERFFARYREDEAGALLGAAGFEILERRAGTAPNRRWLTFLATRSR